MTKNASQITQDLATLEAEQASVTALIRSIPELSKAAARATTENILGRVTVAELNAAQSRLDNAQAALQRADALQRAIAETKGALDWQAGAERRQFCESIANDFKVTYAEYVEQGKALLATYRRLQGLNNKYLAMTNRPLLEPFNRELNLPQLTGALSGRSTITTGQEG